MKKVFVIVFALLALCLVFTACNAEPGDNTVDGIIGGNPETISNRVTDNTGMRNGRTSTSYRIRTTVDDYYRTREGLYGTTGRNTFGNYAAGDGYYGTGSSGYNANTGNASGTIVRDRDYANQGVVRNDMDTNANLTGDQLNGSTEVTDPIAKSGLIRNGSDNME